MEIKAWLLKQKMVAGLVLLLMIGFSSVFISLYLHPGANFFTWKSEIWADRAGYYIYLPAVFMYDLKAEKAPENIDLKTGDGFWLNHENNTIGTKYTNGVAILLSPFFIVTRIYCQISGKAEDGGFSPTFHRMTDVAAIIYLLLGMWFLNAFLSRYFKPLMNWLIILLVFYGTNLFYYSVADPLMSHVYSFFLFSGFLFFMNKFFEEKKYIFFLALSVFAAFILLIRPTNIVVLSLFFLWDISSFKDFRERIMIFISPHRIFTFIIAVIIIFTPQILYWKYLTGNLFYYSYGNETFSNWNNPRIVQIWFSTLNGLFIYSPLVLFFIAGMILMMIRKIRNGILISGIFILISYIISSWYNWYYGCSFGQRSFVEYYAVFSVPFGYLLVSLEKRKYIFIPIIIVAGLMAVYNVAMTRVYDGCFFGSTWDCYRYSLLLDKATFHSQKIRQAEIKNDFENGALCGGNKVDLEDKHSGIQSMKLDNSMQYCCKNGRTINDLKYYPEKVHVSLWILNKLPSPTKAMVAFSIEKNGKTIPFLTKPIDPFLKYKKWSEVKMSFDIPAGIEGSSRLVVYIWNKEHSEFIVDDMTIIFEK